jgi:hypothetical protein
LYFAGLELEQHERKTLYVSHLQPVVAALAIRLRSWIDSGEIRRVDPETAVIGILGVLLSQLQLRELVGPVSAPDNPIEKLSSEYTDLCLCGLQEHRD